MTVQAPPMRPAAIRPGGWVGAATSTDHKRIGINLACMSLIFFVVGGIFALVMRSQLAGANNHVVSDGTYAELFTMHGSTMIYLFVSPMAIAMAMYLCPLQIGATSISGPRTALTGFWIWLGGGLLMQAGWFTQSGPGQAGWFSYVPLSESSNTPGIGQNLWTIGVLLAALGMLLMGWCVLVTILRRRAPGMALLRMPIFTWTSLVTVLMVIAGFPALILAMGLLFIDRTTNAHIFVGFTGAIDYQDIFWFFGHPVVYVMFFPFLGAAAEAIATCAHKRWFGYKAFVASMMAFSALSMSVWGHHMFITGGITNQYFAATSTALIVPAGIEYFDVVGTLIGGKIVVRASLLFGLGFFLQFLIGGLSGIWVASPPLDYAANDTYFVVAHFHYTLFAGSVFGFFAGVYHWFPKVTGARLREGLGKVHFVLLTIGTNLTFFPMFLVGEAGMPRRIARYPQHPGWQTDNLLETIGAFIIALGVLVFLINVLVSLRRREVAGDDPWEGQTLEWATSSPPPPFNFNRPLPPIRSYAPLLDLRERAAEDAGSREKASA
ncbi:MAG TPA: cbb3-type cytochrome c oxidase subunit I [Solirubrobacteraceae bacterium]|nr:cbb3-type cytochrome c oxidase subunit I [Solirubrobacteraceae bacterium]